MGSAQIQGKGKPSLDVGVVRLYCQRSRAMREIVVAIFGSIIYHVPSNEILR